MRSSFLSYRALLPALLFSACFINAGCGENRKTQNDGTISATEISESCDCNELTIDSTGFHTKEGAPYTGTCTGYYTGTRTRYIEKKLLAGKLHGKVSFYDRDGHLLFEEIYENGEQKRVNPNQVNSCQCDELELVKTPDAQYPVIARLDDIPFTGRCEKKYDGSEQLYMERNYKNGLLDGYTVYYNRDGSTILMEKYSNGQLVSTVN